MMRIGFEGYWDVVAEATSRANLILAAREFYDAIRAHSHFDRTEASPSQVAEAMERCTVRLSVHLYKSWNPLSRALGYEDERWPDRVFLNTRRLNRSAASVVGTIIHEAAHAADAHSPLDFGHGGNSSVGKDNTAPYWIGNLAISMVGGTTVAVIDHAPHEEEALA